MRIKFKKTWSTVNCQRLTANSGFTFVELVISVAMIAILSASIIQMARFSDTHKSLTLASDEFRAALRTAQSSALSIPNPQDRHVCGFGVYIPDNAVDNQYEVFYTYVDNVTFVDNPEICKTDSSYRDGTTGYEIVNGTTLPESVTFQNPVNETIFFIVPYGETYDNNGNLLGGNVTFTIINLAGDTKSIVVTPMGKID